MSDLNGKRVALLEARMGSELARLVARYGGEAFSFPALREQTIDAADEVAALLDGLAAGEFHFIIFQTGVGVAALFNEAEKLGRLDELLAALKTITTVCRGPKPTAVLARHGLKPSINAPAPYTTTELLAAMTGLALKDKKAAVLHYGERNQTLTETLQARGAELTELCLYEWQLPEDTTPLKNLIAELPRGQFDAVLFTSQIQARHLFQIAREMNRADELLEALNNKTVVASIGPTCSEALRGLGVEPRVEPENPKMAPLLVALVNYFAVTSTT